MSLGGVFCVEFTITWISIHFTPFHVAPAATPASDMEDGSEHDKILQQIPIAFHTNLISMKL